MSFSNMRISRKLAVAFVTVIVGFSIASGVVFLQLGRVKDLTVKNDRTYSLSMDVQAVLRSMVEQQNAVRAYLITSDEAFLKTFEDNGRIFDSKLADFRENTSLPEQKQRADELERRFRFWRMNSAEKQVALARDPTTRDQALAMTGKTTLAQARETADLLFKTQDQLQDQRMAEQGEALKTAMLALFMGLAAAVAMAIAACVMLARAIATPVAQMTSVMGRLAEGDNAVAIPGGDRADEIGEMSKAVLVFKEAAIEKAAEDDSRQGVVEAIGNALGRLAAGDLTCRITADLPAGYRKLQDDFNGAVDKLQDALKVIVVNAEGITSGAGEISQAADDLSRRTEQQAATLEQTAAALDQITATVKRTAEGAGQANSAVNTARSDAEQGGEVVRQAVTAMNGIERSAGEISQIIGVIDEIAFQTNLLALNAGVEAARAGDAGKGFAVVASEVRALAQRSAEAAKEIKSLISTSTGQVKEGVDLVGRTGEALHRIVSQVSEITGLVAEIAASAQEQSTALSQVNTAVNQMDQMTQQNAAMVEQSTAASHSLAKEAEQLSGLVARFQIGPRGARSQAGPQAARPPARLAEAKAGVHAPSANPLAAARARLASFAGSHGRATAAAVEDEWEEF